MKLKDRILYRLTGQSEVRQGEVFEFSPSGKYVRMGYTDVWHLVANVQVIEHLPKMDTVDVLAEPATPAVDKPVANDAATDSAIGDALDKALEQQNPTLN